MELKENEEDQKSKISKSEIDRIITYKHTSFINPFDILNIPYNSTEEQIKRKFRSIAMIIHPDKCNIPEASDAFHILESAFKTLINPETKYNFKKIYLAAKERVEMNRKEINEQRKIKKLPLLPNDTIDDEIREMIIKINKENEDNKKNEEELKFAYKKRERDMEKENEDKKIESEKRQKEWEGFRDKRVRNWNRFKDRAKKKKNMYEIKARCYKMEEKNDENQITIYQEKSII